MYSVLHLIDKAFKFKVVINLSKVTQEVKSKEVT
jgi:hypothetical protein